MQRLLFSAMLLLPLSTTYAQQPIGLFEGQTDVGPVLHAGAAHYDADAQTYTVSGSGTNMWAASDEFHFVWKRLAGDFVLRAHAAFLGEGVAPHRKLGLIIRAGLDTGAAYADAAVHGDGLAALQFRRAPGALTEEKRSDVSAPDVIQLARTGTTYTMSVARMGEPFVETAMADLDLGDEVFVGLFVTAHDPDVVETATFSNVRIVRPAPPDFVPYRDFIGSNLEILDVETGRRRVVFHTPRSIQAPNWTPDGRALIYNGDGLLYRFDLARQAPEIIPTGFATQNNNDHVLSFDGTMLGISHHDAASGHSLVYTVPVEGGLPRQATPTGPSYLHGWSPDGQWLVYTGSRDGAFDLYKIPVAGGDEVRLTDAPGLDDGSEYAPDGQHIYFNSARTGRMQLWRMRPDGSAQEQLTDDGFNNWFPHVSPDGKWIVFLSYGPDVAAGDHPWYQPVYLRLMPAAGGAPRVVAYVYGGQGTINVPSWAPDSRHVAFVSNTAFR